MKKKSKTKIAATYATALYAAAEEKKAVDAVLQDVEKLLPVVKADAAFIKFMANPLYDMEEKKEVLAEVAKKLRLSAQMLSCLEVIDENSRFADLEYILAEFKHIYFDKHNIVQVDVDSVKKLSAAQDKKLAANLEKLLNKKVVINYTITPDILGGLRIKFGSSMIDDSLQNKLNRLEIVMKGGQ